MSRKLLGFLMIKCALLLSVAHAAELTFETKLRKITAKPESRIIYAQFPFVNNSKETITIDTFNAPCTCMEARLKRADGKESLVFKPGDKGIVIGELDFENFTGTADKVITIKTTKDKENAPSITLTASVTIPILVVVEHPQLAWPVGSPLTPKQFSIKVDYSKPINIIKHELGFYANEAFTYTFETIKEGFEYRVTVTPKSTATPKTGVLRFNTDCPIDRYKKAQIYLFIKKQKNK